jgi:CHAT domain-containing protein
LLQQIDALATMAAESTGDADLAAESIRTRERLERARTEFSERFARTEQAPAGRHSLALDSLQAQLAPDEVLIEFLMTDRDALVFAVTREGVVGQRTDTVRDELAQRARVARELAGRADAPETLVRATFGALGKTLLGSAPIQAALSGKRAMVIVPHGDLVYVPFASLVNPSTNRFMVDDLAMTQSPSAAVLARTRGQRAVVAEPSVEVFAPFTRDLPFSATEARAVRMSLFARHVFENRAATETELRRALGSASVVHVATHGILNRQNPLFSRIDLARPRNPTRENDGRLEVHEVLGLPISAWLVFLSGCDTGVGVAGSTRFERGEDFSTLAQAFLMAGAKNVIATLWPVRDDGAAVFAEKFYAALASNPTGGRSAAAHALAQAQREMRADARFAAPYYWAGYALSGSGWIGAAGGSK